jgi:hypothetical protein
MVGLQTLDLAIGVRVPASQPIICNELRAAYKLPVVALYHYCVTTFGFVSKVPAFVHLAKEFAFLKIP